MFSAERQDCFRVNFSKGVPRLFPVLIKVMIAVGYYSTKWERDLLIMACHTRALPLCALVSFPHQS